MRSGSAGRFGSVAGSHWSLRTSANFLPISFVSNLYGPEEMIFSRYFAPVSLSFGTGAVIGIWTM